VFLNGTSAQLGYTVPFTLGVQEKYICARVCYCTIVSFVFIWLFLFVFTCFCIYCE